MWVCEGLSSDWVGGWVGESGEGRTVGEGSESGRGSGEGGSGNWVSSGGGRTGIEPFLGEARCRF